MKTYALLAVIVAAATRPALAQDIEEIIVTGSRVSRNGFDSPQPLTTIDSEQIRSLGIVNVGDVLRTLPQNTPFFAETNVGFGNFNVGSQLANLRGLNPFFGTRTLTLVDTKRVVPTTEGGAVDLTLIPSMLVARTEVVTGGASAAYGSDAIAGVVNVILDTKLEGMRAQVDYGETGEGDGGDTHASFAYGTAFADQGRGHVLGGAEYQKQDKIGACSRTRDWCKDGWGVGTNAQFNTPAGVGNGLPNFVVALDGKSATSNTGVLTVAGVPRQFNENGTALLPYDPGRFPGPFARFGGDGDLLVYDLSSIRPEIERYSLLGHASYEISDRLDFFAEAAYSRSDASNDPAFGAAGPFGAGITVAADNAFLTPAVLALAPAGGVFSRVLLPDVVTARNTTENQTTRFVTGFDGHLAQKWTWDAYYQHGENENHQRVFHGVVNGGAFAFLGWAIDSVRSIPADTASPIVCRATLPGPGFRANAVGCIPLNIFGNGNANPAALEYAFRTLQEDSNYEQDVLGANFRTKLAEGWAGPIAFATGLEWRHDQAETTHDIANQPWYSSYVFTYGLDRGGDIDVLEAYGEIEVPMAEKVQTNFSARQTRHEATSATGSTSAVSHEFTSWKASAIYDPLEWLRFRATLSRDVRAAGFRELFLPRVDTEAGVGRVPGAVTNPWNSNIAEDYLSISGGNPDLEPEKADTKTFGTVLSFDKFRFSGDWFEIELTDAITPGGGSGIQAQALINACFSSGGTGEVCSAVTGAGTADVTAVDSRSINIGKFVTRGWDWEASYAMPMSKGGILALRFIATYLYDMTIDTGLGTPAVDYRNQSGPVASFGGFNTSPDWQARAWVTYARDRFTSTFETRYIGSGKLNAIWTESPAGSSTNTRPFTVTDNSVDDAYYLSWSGSFDIGAQKEAQGTQLFWVINNLLDKNPPIAPGGNSYPTNPVFFDTLGRRFRLGVRFAF